MSASEYSCRRILMYNPQDVCVGDVVQLKQDALRGVVRFIGEVRQMGWSCRTFAYYRFGIELFEAKGDNDGTLEGEYFFDAAANHGVFVKSNAIAFILTPNFEIARVTIDEVIYMKRFRCNGRIRFVGRFPGDAGRCDGDSVHFGIELELPHGNNAGFVGDRNYISNIGDFHGVFVTNRDLFGLGMPSRSSLLFHRFLGQRFIPSDVVLSMAAFLSSPRGEFHKTVEFEAGGKSFKYNKFDFFDIDGRARGPVVLKPVDYSVPHDEDTDRGIKINVADKGCFAVFDQMAAKYGLSARQLKHALNFKEELHFHFDDEDEDGDAAEDRKTACFMSMRMNGIRFVDRDRE